MEDPNKSVVSDKTAIADKSEVQDRTATLVLEIPEVLADIVRTLLSSNNHSIEVLNEDDRVSSKGSTITITTYDMTEEQQIAMAMFSKSQRKPVLN